MPRFGSASLCWTKGKTFGALMIYATEPQAFSVAEIRLLGELAGDLAFGIIVLRNRIERIHAEEALRLLKQRNCRF